MLERLSFDLETKAGEPSSRSFDWLFCGERACHLIRTCLFDATQASMFFIFVGRTFCAQLINKVAFQQTVNEQLKFVSTL